MTTVLLIESGVVVDAICSDSLAKAQQFFPTLVCVERPDGMTVGPGWTYDGQTFHEPVPVQLPKQPLTKLQFLERFTAQQRIAIRAARTSDPVIDDALQLLDLAENVQTDRADTQAWVQYLVVKGLLTADNASAILE
jgi:hypothetical protein